MSAPLHVVTGALGYTGKSITERLIARGVRVRTLTRSPRRPNPFGEALDIRPFNFDDPEALMESLRGAEVLYNTYWVRFNHRLFTFEQAVRNTKTLFEAAKRAGVRRIVHVSILHAERAPYLAYYRSKAELERSLRSLGVPHSILRPGVLFGRGDILVNNIAWVLRRLPIFGVFGNGTYKLQPMHVDDMADLSITHGGMSGDTQADAVGPETFTYRELVREIARVIGVSRAVVSVPPWLGLAVSKLVNPFVGDVIITREEIIGLMENLLISDHPPTGRTKLTEWASAHRATLGQRYASEVGRRVKRDVEYEKV